MLINTNPELTTVVICTKKNLKENSANYCLIFDHWGKCMSRHSIRNLYLFSADFHLPFLHRLSVADFICCTSKKDYQVFTLTLQTLLGHNIREDFSQNRFVGGLEFSST